MSDLAMRVEGLGKRYRIGARPERYQSLRDKVANLAKAPVQALRNRLAPGAAVNGEAAEFWALRDLSFTVGRGEIVGVLGHNGAGKSTLLKVLSRITEPTEGRAVVWGRVSSLLEVGTGFHPELTGRENIFLNGAILGMNRAEIERKFDEIVEFSEVGRFIDTPVKHYSSGMYLRLAFAVAAHLESDVLFVDEVLAVGDAQFQRKCFQKMRDVSRTGLTILFVSHNMAAVREICTRGLVLERGQVVRDGPIEEVADWYISRIAGASNRTEAVEGSSFVVEEVQVGCPDAPAIKTFSPLRIAVRFRTKCDILDASLVVIVRSKTHQLLGQLNYKDFRTCPPLVAGQVATFGFLVDDLPLLPGEYLLEVRLMDRVTGRRDDIPQLFPFEVVQSNVYGGRRITSDHGVIGFHMQAFEELEDGTQVAVDAGSTR